MSERMRLDKLLSNMGVGSRNEIKALARRGEIMVDGTVVKDCSLKVDAAKAHVTVSGREVVYRPYVYLMMNKPPGVISATEDRLMQTVLDLLPREYAHFALFPAGRLDRDTEGLLLLTNDGQLAHDLLSPRKHVEKVYAAEIEGAVGEADAVAFATGVMLEDGYITKPARLWIDEVDERLRISRIRLAITEGKFHQVKRMFVARGMSVRKLKRIAFASLQLDEQLQPGEFRELTAAELDALRQRKTGGLA